MNGIRAYLLTASQRQTLQAYPDGALAWNDQGILCYAGPWSKRPKKSAVVWEELRDLIVTPGFIDVHCHLPQYPSVGSGGYPLLPWLKKFIFPLERAFTPKRAELEAPLFYNDLKRNGISSAVVYTTDNPKSTDVCFEAAKASGLRITMGQMMMDINCDRARSEKQLATRTLNESAALCERWHRAENGRLNYAFSPRFVITCTKTFPLSKNSYLVLVAPRGEFNPHGLSAFLAQAGQGVNYAKGVWHYALAALYEVSEFIVIDRGGAGSNCEEVHLGEPVIISEKDLHAAGVCSPPGIRLS